jgi:exodeoxyribonuclease V alpha subunit
VGRLNAAIEQRLGRGRRPAGSVWYPGRMVMVSANDYPTRLFNGDVGIARADRSGQIVVCFRGADGAPREMPAARLPAHEPAFAISIHKSQGSEFDAVLVVLPRGDSPILSRELLYTAISRARHRVAISGSAGVLRSAIERPQVRDSGLAGLLWGPAVAAGS